jgi:GTP-binding protein
VGKSSLLNMVCNRKDLAYVSKRPGKTQQFNYFLVNNRTRNAFYLVDIPGVGYARVSVDQKDKWAMFFEDYVSERDSLRVIFHLIDSRHGPLAQDLKIMDAITQRLPHHVSYVVVLTKADKKDGKVSPTVRQVSL